jgi:hypothetical protein
MLHVALVLCAGLISAALPHQKIIGISVLKGNKSLNTNVESLFD